MQYGVTQATAAAVQINVAEPTRSKQGGVVPGRSRGCSDPSRECDEEREADW